MDTNKSNLVKEDIVGVVTLAESGLGICQSYDFIVNEKIQQGKLQPPLQYICRSYTSFFLCYMRSINTCPLLPEL